MDLSDIIRERIQHQLIRGNPRQRLREALDKALWLYGDQGLMSRTTTPMRNPLKRLDNQIVKVPVGRANRILSLANFVLLYSGRQREVQDKELMEIVHGQEEVIRSDLAKQLDTTVRKLNYRLRKEMKRWNLFRMGENVYDAQTFVQQQGGPVGLEKLVMEVLKRYPFLSADQIAYLTGLERYQLSQTLSKLAAQNKIRRGITREGAPDELFVDVDCPNSDPFEFESFVLEKRDALVEIIKMERYFEHKEADYWIFVDGVPQAEFDLTKKSRSQTYMVTNLSRFNTTTLDLHSLLEVIRNWGETQRMTLNISSLNDPLTKFTVDLTSAFIHRGYHLHEDKLLLDKQKAEKKKQKREISQDHMSERIAKSFEKLDWRHLGSWLRAKQFIGYDGTAHEILYELGQLDEIISLAYRLDTAPERVDLSNVIYFPGINHRFGFVAKELVEDIIEGWPREGSYSFLDKKIMGTLFEAKTTREIISSTGSDPKKIRQRLRYLEQLRRIRKVIPGSLSMSSCQWIKFEQELPNFTRSAGSKRKIASIGVMLKKLLGNHPPLTKKQLSKYLGMSSKELRPFLRYYLQREEILEGYFLVDVSSIQYTLPSLHREISIDSLEQYPSSQRADLLPLSDPYAFLHLPPVVMTNPSIQLTERLDRNATQWMIAFDGQPAGFLVLTPSKKPLIDYDTKIFLTEPMTTIPVLSGTLQTLAKIMQSWYGNKGRIKEINGIAISHKRWDGLQFIIESLDFAI